MLIQHHPLSVIEESLAAQGPNLDRETGAALDWIEIELGEGANYLPFALCKGECMCMCMIYLKAPTIDQDTFAGKIFRL